MAMKDQAELPMGIVVERRAIDNPWIDHRWKPIAVIPGAAPMSPFGDWILLREGEGWAHFQAGTLMLQLFPKETEGYKLNLSQTPPRLYVGMRNDEEGECAHEMFPFLVTACPYEAQDYLDSGEELVEAIAMPPGVIAFIEDYVAHHHVDEPFYKRKRKPARTGDEAFARRPAGPHGRRGNGDDG